MKCFTNAHTLKHSLPVVPSDFISVEIEMSSMYTVGVV